MALYCSKCKETKPEEDFSKNRSSRTGFQTWCKSCSKTSKRQSVEAQKAWWDNNRDERYRIIIEWCPDGCLVCGWKDVRAIDQHHVDPSQKDREVSRWTNAEALKEELKKCVPLCANHHRVLHANLRLAPAGATTDEMIEVMRSAL
jgi:hypothetical protein